MMRTQIARLLTLRCARAIDADYDLYCLGTPHEWHRRYSNLLCRVLLPIARHLDGEATTTEMIRHGWWG